tara:strand:- start:41029 stop:44475 length:3447 start_codon:yes stop_codon:yes gene_type:complete
MEIFKRMQPNDKNDLITRMKALESNSSFIVSAPAGSGKTGLLTQRFLRLLSSVNNPEEILCITFTKKAASEMSNRVYEALKRAEHPVPPDQSHEKLTWDLAIEALNRSKKMNWRLTDLPDRLRIQTIDGFTRNISNQFCLETTLRSSFEPCDQPKTLYGLAARNLLDQLDDSSDTSNQLKVLISHLGNNFAQCEKYLSHLLQSREQWLPLIYRAASNHNYFQQVMDKIVVESLSNLKGLLKPISTDLLSVTKASALYLSGKANSPKLSVGHAGSLPNCDTTDLPRWKNLISQFLTTQNRLRSVLRESDGFPKGKSAHKNLMLELIDWCRRRPAIIDMMKYVMYLPTQPIDKTEQKILNSLTFLLPRLVAELNVIFQDKKQCDYPSITLSALEAVSNNFPIGGISDVTLRLDYQLRHILVDEFQDTSASQIRIIESLLSGWEPEDGRSFFAVGDAMQSIYSFRNANVGLFLRAQQFPIGQIKCEALNLYTNYRCYPSIVNWVNKHFDNSIGNKPNLNTNEVKFTPSSANKISRSNTGVEFVAYDGTQFDKFEAERVAKICLDIRDNQEPQTVAILVRNRTHLKHIIPELNRVGIDWKATDIYPLKLKMVVIDLLSLTRGILSPTDRVAWFGILRAPFCGFELHDLHTISTTCIDNSTPLELTIVEQVAKIYAEYKVSGVTQLTHNGQIILERVAPILVSMWDSRMRGRLCDTVEKYWLTLGGDKTLSNDGDYEDAERYLQLLSICEVNGSIQDWESFQSSVDALYSAPRNSGSQHKHVTQFNIMTIHKSKGLEFDQVLLPGLSRAGIGSDQLLLQWREYVHTSGEVDLLLSTMSAHDETDSDLFKFLKFESKRNRVAENKRLLYVACTRPVKKLFLFAQIEQSKNMLKNPAQTSLLHCIWHSIAEEIKLDNIIVEKHSELLRDMSPSKNYQDLRRLPPKFKPENNVGFGIDNRIKQLDVNSDTLRVKVAYSDTRSFRARALGTVLHRTLKQISLDGTSEWTKRRIKEHKVVMNSRLREIGFIATVEELKELELAICKVLNDKVGRWILGSHDNTRVEYSINYKLKPNIELHRSTIDLTFVENGYRWIIDYKYYQQNEQETEEDFHERVKSENAPQLLHYRWLFKKMGQVHIKCAIYLLGTCKLLEIPYQ